MAFAGIHDRAHGGKQVASPVRTKSIERDLFEWGDATRRNGGAGL